MNTSNPFGKGWTAKVILNKPELGLTVGMNGIIKNLKSDLDFEILFDNEKESRSLSFSSRKDLLSSFLFEKPKSIPHTSSDF